MAMKGVADLLGSLTVLDLTDEKGQLCGKLFADLGADVIKVEPPGGDPVRHKGPFVDDNPGPENGLFWLAMNTGKKSAVIDLKTEDGRQQFRKLAAGADLVLESFAPGCLESLGLGYETLSRKNPGLIMTAITPFGQTGPHRDFAGPDLICMALSGEMNLCGSPDGRPLRISVPQAYFHASLEAAVGSLFAYWHRLQTGRGQYVDVSCQEALVWEGFNNHSFWYTNRQNLEREGDWRGYGKGQRVRVVFPCKDGHVIVSLTGGRLGAESQRALVRWIDDAGMADDYLRHFDWLSFGSENRDERISRQLEERIGPFYKTKTKQELFERALQDRLLLGPIYTTADILESDLFKGVWTTLEHPETGKTIPYPAIPYRSSLPNHTVRGTAPRLGQDTETVLARERERSDTQRQPAGTTRASGAGAGGRLMFDGLNILDLSWVIAGPAAVRYFADYGARVVRVESRKQLDTLRTIPPFKDRIPGVDRGSYFANYNSNKYGITLDLKNPGGMAVAKRLVAWADVVVENFAPGVIEKLGLGYEVLSAIKPDIIMASTSQLGKTGPPFRGFGTQGAAMAGIWSVTGYPGGGPTGLYGAYCDFIANRFMVIAILMALEEKRRTGRGQCIDQAQVVSSLQFLAPALLDFAVNGRVARPQGNRDPDAAPHNAYRCAGNDRWVAIAVFTDEQWNALRQIMGNPAWAKADRFSTLAGRKANEDELDRLMDHWTSPQKARHLMTLLQGAGVPAGLVSTAEDLFSDPQLAHRGHFILVDHPVLGSYSSNSPGFRFSGAKPRTPSPSPCHGEHNEWVAREILGMSLQEWSGLLAAGAFG